MHRSPLPNLLALLAISACSGPAPSVAPSFAPSPSAVGLRATAEATSSAGPATPQTSTQIAGGTWTATQRMIWSHGGHTATLLNDGLVLVVGNCSGESKSAELYDSVSRSWTATGGPLEVCGATATLLPDGRVLLAGGKSTRGGRRARAGARLYDPVNRAWNFTGSMGMARYGHTATLLPVGKVLVAGGTDSADTADSAELYDPEAGTWTATGNMNESRADHTATLLNDGRVLVLGAFYPLGASAELYDSATGTWTATASMSGPRIGHTATLLADGRVLVAGGAGDSGLHVSAMDSAELYDPATASWTTTGRMLEGDAFKAATLLPNGNVLVAGGYVSDSSDTPIPNAELYDPLSGSWSIAGLLRSPSSGPTATLLSDGTVLVCGGTHWGEPTDWAETYDTAST